MSQAVQIQFIWKNVEPTQRLQKFTEDKFAKLHRHAGNIAAIHVTFDVNKVRQIAVAQIQLRGKKQLHLHDTDIHASAETENMYKSVDLLLQKLIDQISKYKERSADH